MQKCGGTDWMKVKEVNFIMPEPAAGRVSWESDQDDPGGASCLTSKLPRDPKETSSGIIVRGYCREYFGDQ